MNGRIFVIEQWDDKQKRWDPRAQNYFTREKAKQELQELEGQHYENEFRIATYKRLE